MERKKAKQNKKRPEQDASRNAILQALVSVWCVGVTKKKM